MASLVSVVIPAFRAELTIGRALGSALAQDACGEVIVVLDGDPEPARAIVAGLSDSRVRTVARPENRGAQRSRNEGLALAAHPLVMFLDGDDFLEGPLLAGLRDAIEAADADLGFAPMQILREDRGRRDAVFQPNYASAADLFRRWFVDRQFVAPCSVVWRADFLRAIGGWDETIRKNQDGELTMRAVLSGARFALSSRGRGVYVRHARASISKGVPPAAALLNVAEKVLAMPTQIVSADEKRRACAMHAYGIAWDCFIAGDARLGGMALERSRALGFRGHRGPLAHRMAGTLLGLRRKTALLNSCKRWIARVRLGPSAG